MSGLDMNYQEYCDYVEDYQKKYVDYLVDISAFDYLYEQILKRTEYPRFRPHNKKVELETVKQKVINNTKDILSGVDLTIKWLDEDIIDGLEKEYGDQAHRYIMESAHTGTIFDIPVVQSESYTAYIKSYNKKDDTFKDRVYKNIALIDDWATDSIECTYFHELGHALIGRKWYMGLNPLYEEYIPHFLEMYYNYFILDDYDVFRRKLIPKMAERANSFMCLNRHHRSLGGFNKGEVMYLVGLFLSCITFEKYCDFNLQTKKEMENDLKAVLNGNCFIEEFLDKYDINLHTNEAITLYKRTTERVKSYNP